MSIRGVIDRVTNRGASGWIFDDDRPDEHPTIVFLVGGEKHASTVADIHRSDLQANGVGNGDHGFNIVFKPEITTNDYNSSVFVSIWPDGTEQEMYTGDAVLLFGAGDPASGEMHPSLRKLLKYGPVYAESSQLMPPVGVPQDLVKTADMTNANLLRYMAGIDMDAAQLQTVLARDRAPVPHVDNREGYGPGQDLIYWISGYSDYLRIQSLAAQFGVETGRFFDFGGATGRVFRNFALQTDKWDVWTCDFKESHLAFNAASFPSTVRCFLNTAFPSLPIPDGYFSLITACSVFTHINETETSWLLELRRTLRIGGLAFISIHNEETWSRMTGELRRTVEEFRRDVAERQTIPAGRTVVTFRDDDPYNCNVFHTNDYIRQNWGRYFEICAIESCFLDIQAMVVCRRID